MSFLIRSEALKWFEHIRKRKATPIHTEFDLYYFCFMAGIGAGRMGDVGSVELVDYFVEDYRPMQRILIGLLIVAELGRTGRNLSEREEVNKMLEQYIDPQSASSLTKFGFTQMNKYASGGFDFLAEKCSEKPQHIEDFLQIFGRVLTNAVDGSDRWKPFLEDNHQAADGP